MDSVESLSRQIAAQAIQSAIDIVNRAFDCVVNAALRDLTRPVRPLEQRRAPTDEQVAEAIALAVLRNRKGWQTTAALGIWSISRQRLDAALASLARGGLVARCETALGPMWRARAAGVRAPMPGLGVSSCAESAR